MNSDVFNEQCKPIFSALADKVRHNMSERGLSSADVARVVCSSLGVNEKSAQHCVFDVKTPSAIYLTPAQTSAQIQEYFRKIAIVLAAVGIAADDEHILEIKEHTEGLFKYPPNGNIAEEKFHDNYSTLLLAEQLKLLRPEHRSVLEGLANTYLARYEEEERADYNGSD